MKTRSEYVCSNCGAKYSTWAGKCDQCQEWNTIEEVTTLAGSSVKRAKPLKVADFTSFSALEEKRQVAQIGDTDQVLGGGFVVGSVNLIAGQPGIGKSTLLLQVAVSLAQRMPVLYVSGEESGSQVSSRAKRLGAAADKLLLAASNSADEIAATIAENKYDVVIVDSIQTISTETVSSTAGSVSQISSSSQLIIRAAKVTATTVIIVGHVTKEGSIAGPKVLEHLVDVVLQLDGDTYGEFKVLRASKNRYGPTSEAAIFEMKDQGLQAVANPSAALLAERKVTDGSVVLATLEGTRPLLVEVQALVNKTSYGYPKRAASGIDLNRLNLLIAVLERRTKLDLADKDIYINVVGGVKIQDRASDLAVCMAIGSAAKGLSLFKNAVVFGEVGLSGELRHVSHVDQRISEAQKLGFDCAVGPTQKSSHGSFLDKTPDVRTALNNYLRKS